MLLLTPLPIVLAALTPVQFWASEPAEDSDRYRGLVLNEAVLEAQSRLLPEALAAVQAPRPDRINVFALTYAPYAEEDVFLRESAAVAKTLRERFGAQAVELVMNPATTTALPFATPSNLRKAIGHLAAVMDRERDLLFIHLGSHGGADGRLAVNTWPLHTEPMTPQLLRQWLDEAGVRWRVVSVSACYSGSWVTPLAGDGTLVLTAADADHTSYGCGRRSPMTFYGQAMYVEALQETRSFAEAHALARERISEREKAAGKDDGYSNPQISLGTGIQARLQRLEQELIERP